MKKLIISVVITAMVGIGIAPAVTASPNPASRNSCKAIQKVLAQVGVGQATMMLAFNTYETWLSRGETAQANQSLRSFKRSERGVQRALDRGARVAKNSETKRQFQRWSNAFRLNLPSSGRVADRAKNKIESLMIDGKC